MFRILKMALVTSAFYVVAAVLLEGLIMGVVYWEGGISYTINFKSWAIVFGAIWLASFALTWKVVDGPTLGQVPVATPIVDVGDFAQSPGHVGNVLQCGI